jgi:hypothetical protein
MCLACHAEWMREHRPKHRDLPPEARLRADARSYANVYQRRGKLVPKSCTCGEPGEKHHTDYSQPLVVVWLCRPCHLAEHRGIGGGEDRGQRDHLL